MTDTYNVKYHLETALGLKEAEWQSITIKTP
jgi:hypothetical protein